jgi:hypothetical protein
MIKRENLLLVEDLEESIQAGDRRTEMDAKLKGFQKRAHRCRVQLDNFHQLRPKVSLRRGFFFYLQDLDI